MKSGMIIILIVTDLLTLLGGRGEGILFGTSGSLECGKLARM